MADTNLIYPYQFQGGRKAVASEVNANFEAVKTFANGINVSLNDIRSALSDLKNKPTREMLDIFYSFSSVTPAGAYPLWTGETINHCKSLYPQFWNKVKNLSTLGNLVTVTSDEYEERLETYGQCGAFYLDELNGHLRLPKINCFISSIADLTELAKEQNSGLPNIKGMLRPYRMSSPSGAFYDSQLGDFYHTSSKDGSSAHAQYSTMFDASKSNAIYGASETVQPPSVKLCLFIQVANSAGEISELDTQAIAKELGKALEEMEESCNSYEAQLRGYYQSIKDDILSASTVIKETDVIVSPSMFVENSSYADYPYCVNIPLEDADENLFASVIFDVDEAASGNYAPVAETALGLVKIFAKEKAEVEFTIPSIVLI